MDENALNGDAALSYHVSRQESNAISATIAVKRTPRQALRHVIDVNSFVNDTRCVSSKFQRLQ